MEERKHKILAIETSTPTLSLALLENNSILAEYNVFNGSKHDKLCAEFARRLLEDNSLRVEELTAVAVSSGPGSFTGLRIGMAFAKGLTFLNTPKLIIVPTLAAMIENSMNFLQNFDLYNKFSSSIKIIAIAPSHSNFYYYQEKQVDVESIYNNNNFHFETKNKNEVQDVKMVDYESLLKIYNNKDKNKDKVKNLFLTTTQPINLPFGILLPGMSNVKADLIGRYATELLKNNIITLSEDAVPMYVQDFVPKTSTKQNLY